MPRVHRFRRRVHAWLAPLAAGVVAAALAAPVTAGRYTLEKLLLLPLERLLQLRIETRGDGPRSGRVDRTEAHPRQGHHES